MSYVRWKVIRYAFNKNSSPPGWSVTGTEIEDFFDPMVSVSLGDKKDTFKLKLNNPYGRWDNYFQPKDKIEIYRTTNSSTFTATDLLMVGVIKDVPTSSSGTTDVINLEGYNLGESITTGIVFYDTGDVFETPLEIVKNALESLQLQNSNFTVTWSNDNPLLTKKNGSAFPTYKKRYFYKPLSKVIEEMLADAATQDGAYFWWIDKDNKLQIRANVGGSPSQYNPTTDYSTISYKDGRDTEDVKNYIILRGGLDASNIGIQTTVVDYTSVSKNGMKFLFWVDKTIDAQSLNQRDVAGQSGSDKYPAGLPGTYTTKWPSSYTGTIRGTSINVTAGSTITVTTKSEYNLALREEIIYQLKQRGNDILVSNGKLKIDLQVVSGSKSWNLGDRVSCTIPRLGITNTELRVREIQKTTELDTYSLEEDIGTI